MDIDLSGIPKAQEVSSLEQAREGIVLQATIIEQLLDQIKILQARVETLEAKLAKNSRNSHKPPSSDGYDKPQPKSRRKKSQRRPGGQRGHKGYTLNQVDTPDERRRYTLSRCPLCGGSLRDVAVQGHERRQVFDVVPAQRLVIEHQVEIKQCPYCQTQVKAGFPDAVEQPVQYGVQLKALVSYYSQYQLLPYQRIQEVFQDVMNVPISQGSISNMLDHCHGQLEGFDANIKAQLIDSPIVHFDETGMKINKARHWLHVASTQTLTYYIIHPKRGAAAMREMGILPQFTGRAIHDHWSVYYRFRCDHGLCNAHHLRELIYVEEQYDQRWAARLQVCLLQAKEEVDQAKRRGQRSLSRGRIAYHQVAIAASYAKAQRNCLCLIRHQHRTSAGGLNNIAPKTCMIASRNINTKR
jgi:transposase